jgi:signal transduction histidine kinase
VLISPAPLNLLRICEESVTNAVKHAHPNRVEVKLEYTSRELQLRICDDGCGFEPHGPTGSKIGHFVLVGIRERVKSLNGYLSLTSQIGKGTTILVTINSYF